MKPTNIVILIAVAVGLATLFYSFMGSQDQSAYVDEIEKEREERDRFMATSPSSPFAGAATKFTKLKYYPPNARYKIEAALTPIQDKQPVILRTNDGVEQHYLKYAYADFDLDGFNNKLLILENMGTGPLSGKLFLAFADETSTVETYGSGRYLDVVKVQGSNSISLDFNKAYNPYCAYIDTYSCPFPPAENLLKIAIKAGEMAYH